MGHRPYIQCILAVFCLFLLSFAGCSPKEEKKPSVTPELKEEKAMDVQYSFDFPDLSQELIRQNYVNVPYNIHKNKLFNFSILMNKNWSGGTGAPSHGWISRGNWHVQSIFTNP